MEGWEVRYSEALTAWGMNSKEMCAVTAYSKIMDWIPGDHAIDVTASSMPGDEAEKYAFA